MLRNRRNFDNATYENALAMYPTADELDATLASDSALHRAALARARVSADGPNPLARIDAQRELAQLTARQAAGELGVSLDELRQSLARLDPRLAPLAGDGRVDRGTFTAVFKASACVLHAGADTPVLGCRE